MPYGVIQDVPADPEMYARIRTRLGSEPPSGLVCHVVLRRPDGLRYVDVWDDAEHHHAFMEQTVEPAVRAVLAELGLPHDHSLVSTEEVEIVDVWQGATAPEN